VNVFSTHLLPCCCGWSYQTQPRSAKTGNQQLQLILCARQDSRVTIITPTKHGLRLSQHGVVISELRTSPGPTHSVFDVLAATIAVLAPKNRIGVLGFAGGGMMSPLRGLGVEAAIDSVDLDRAGYDPVGLIMLLQRMPAVPVERMERVAETIMALEPSSAFLLNTSRFFEVRRHLASIMPVQRPSSLRQ